MSERTMRGVYPILVTPFDEASRVDVDSLQQLVAFELDAGVHGLGVALGSEVFKLSEAERALVTRTVVDAVGGRVPVVINSGGAGTELALLYSRMAEEGGADALMAMPPSFVPAASEGVRAYFRALSAATSLPVYIQDTSSAHVSAPLARQIAEECERVRYIKVESTPTALMVEAAVREAGHLLTVFGGAGGNYLLEELARGSVGTMPGCSHPEAFVQVWDLYQAGEVEAARRAFYERILPINRISGLGWGAFYHVHKEILRQRGAIRTAVVRGPVAPLDASIRCDLQRTIDALYPQVG
jgi:4-hydroxy-tetrahydrodipicolinate synthase